MEQRSQAGRTGPGLGPGADRWRRSAYLTYNVRREGDFHAAYYRAKAAAFADGSAGTISITKDFGGDVVHP